MNPEREYIEKIIGETPEEQYENFQKELSLNEIISQNPTKPDLNKKDSSINEVVSRSKKDKERAENRFAKKFSDPEWEKIKGKEVEKSKKQIKLIHLVDDETNKLREKYGLKKFYIGDNNIHLLNCEDFDELCGEGREYLLIRGVFEPAIQSAIYRQIEKDTLMKFAHITYHEFSHFKNFQKIFTFNRDEDVSRIIPEKKRLEEKNELIAKDIPNASDAYKFIRQESQKDLDLYLSQCGLTIEFGKKNQKKRIAELTKHVPNAEDFSNFLRGERRETCEDCFINIDEAVTEESTLGFQKNILFKHPDFREEVALIKEYVERQKKNGVEVDPYEIISARKIPHRLKAGCEPAGQSEVKGGFILQPKKTESTYHEPGPEYDIEVEEASYAKQREILNMLIDKLYARNMDKFKNRDEVFNVFVKSSYTGNIVGEGSWGRLVTDTYGSKALLKLAKYDKNIRITKSLKKFVEELK